MEICRNEAAIKVYFPLDIKGCIYQAISVYTFIDRYYISLPIDYTKVLNFDTIYSSSSITCIFQTVHCDPVHVSNYLFIATKLKLLKSRIIYRYACMSFLPLWGCRCWWAVRPRERCFYSWCFCLESPSSRWPPQPTGSARARTSGDWRKRERINALNRRNRQQEQQIWGERGLRRARTTKWNRNVVSEGAVTAAANFLWPTSHGKVNFVGFLDFFCCFISQCLNQTKANRNPSSLFVQQSHYSRSETSVDSTFCNLYHSFKSVLFFSAVYIGVIIETTGYLLPLSISFCS